MSSWNQATTGAAARWPASCAPPRRPTASGGAQPLAPLPQHSSSRQACALSAGISPILPANYRTLPFRFATGEQVKGFPEAAAALAAARSGGGKAAAADGGPALGRLVQRLDPVLQDLKRLSQPAARQTITTQLLAECLAKLVRSLGVALVLRCICWSCACCSHVRALTTLPLCRLFVAPGSGRWRPRLPH